MRDKYENKSFIMRMFHKYTGIIIMGIIMAIAVPLYMDYDANKEFFHSYSCQTVYNYMMDKDVPEHVTPHDELSDEQHIQLHQIYEDCLDSEKFNPRIDGH